MKTTKIFLTILFTTYVISAYSQNKEFRFIPAWKIEEERKLVFSSEQPYRDSIENQIIDTRVLGFKNGNYTIKFQINNELYTSLLSMFNPDAKKKTNSRIPQPDSTELALNNSMTKFIEIEFSKFQKTSIIYELNKLTGVRTIKNLEKIRSDNKIMLEKFAEKFNKVSNDTMDQVLLYVLSPALSPFKSAESFEFEYKNMLGLFFFPYGLILAKGDTINKIEKSSHEAGGYRKSLSETSDTIRLWLEKVNEANNTVEIKSKKKSEFDLGRNRTGTDYSEISITYDLKSTWPVKSISKNWREFKSPKVSTTKPGITTLLVE